VPRDLTEQVLTRVSPEPQLNDRHQSRCRKLAPATVQPSLSRLWMGFDTDVTMGLASGTNATQLRVAAGVLSGWSQLGRHKLIHFVEDLNNHEFVSIATEILGRPLVVHDESAPPGSSAIASGLRWEPSGNQVSRAAAVAGAYT
jgi:hypothetical protein